MKIKVLIKQRHEGGIATQFIEVMGEHCLIGRKEADVLLTEARCSRSHALLYLARDGGVHLKDLQSTNGTLLNGLPVTDAPVRVGDEIRIGGTVLVIADLRRTDAPAVEKPEVSIAWTKEDTLTLKEAAQNWPEKFLCQPKDRQTAFLGYIPGKGSVT